VLCAVSCAHSCDGAAWHIRDTPCRCWLRSVARKMGAAVFCTFEDIVTVKPKMIMMFVASVMLVDRQRKSQSAQVAVSGVVLRPCCLLRSLVQRACVFVDLQEDGDEDE
jgi:hypothetical protein